MKNKYYIILNLFLLTLLSCKKEISLPEEKPGIFPFEEKWANKTEFHRCVAIEVTTNCLLYVINDDITAYKDILYGLNLENGDTLWKRNLNYRSDWYKVAGELIFLEHQGELLAIDSKTGANIWKYGGILASKYLNQFTIKGNYIYAFFSINNWSSNLVELYKIDRFSGTATKEYSINSIDFNGYRQIPIESVLFNHPESNNSLIYVQANTYKNGVYGGNFYILDVTADTMYWNLNPVIGKIDSVGKARGYSPLILKPQNTLIINSQVKGTYSLNYRDKNTNWKKNGANYSTIGNRMIYVENKLFLFPTSWSSYIEIININNGQSIQNILGDFAYANSIVVKNDRHMYFIGNGLFIIDSQNGTVKGIDKGYKIGKSSNFFNESIAIDGSGKHLFFTKGHGDYIVCYKIVEGY